jgi:hypothetical protein
MAEALKDYDSVGILSWVGDYEVLQDNTGLSGASSRKFLEDMLSVVRRAMDRKRTFSASSGSSAGSKGSKGLIASTPRSGTSQLNITQDMA